MYIISTVAFTYTALRALVKTQGAFSPAQRSTRSVYVNSLKPGRFVGGFGRGLRRRSGKKERTACGEINAAVW